jgi:thioesterase domain-containing protein
MLLVFENNAASAERFSPGLFPGDLLLFRATEEAEPGDATAWGPFVAGRIEQVDVSTTHHRMMRPEALDAILPEVARRL